MAKRIVRVTAFRPSLKHFSGYYIGNYRDFNIELDFLQRSLGVIKDNYVLELEGKSENIQLYLDYLKSFKLKVH